MKLHTISTIMMIALAGFLAACSVKMAVPGFKHPVYAPDKKWPTLAPAADLEKAADVDVEATLKDVGRLKKMTN